MRDEHGNASAAGPVELHVREVELAIAAAEIEAAEMLLDLEIGRAVFRRPLIGEHRAAEMVAAMQPFESARLAVQRIGRDVAAVLGLVQQVVARRLADVGIVLAWRERMP